MAAGQLALVEEAEEARPEGRHPPARRRRRRAARGRRRLRRADPADRRRRQRRRGRAAGHATGQRADRGDVPAAGAGVGTQAHREDRRRRGVGAAPRHRGPPRPRHHRAADRLPGRLGRQRGRHLQLHGARAAAASRRSRRGYASHISTQRGADPGLGHLQHADLPAAAGRAPGDRGRSGWPTRSTRRSTPGATTRGSSPAPPSSPTTPSASRSTSTCPATSAAPSARWTAASCAVFEKWGFTWGGHWRYTDPMHFEANAIVNPG